VEPHPNAGTSIAHTFAPPAIPSETWTMANALGERERGPRTQIWRIVRVVGIERAQMLQAEAQQVAAGCMQTVDGTPRKLGGLWFRLAKESMTDQERRAAWPRRKRKQRHQQLTDEETT
jgi:Phosphorylated adapter RNA export protein, RNA-binding domain